ncbi:MAG: hypothetical protein ACOCU4_09370 [Alkalispirochaeta sp.]
MDTFVISTCDRPEALAQSLSGGLSTFTGETDSPRFCVFDDTRTEENADSLRSLVATVASEYAIAVDYQGPVERRSWIQKAHDDSEIRDRLAFACLSAAASPLSGPGRNRNAALLFAAGGRLTSIDDDALFNFSTVDTATTINGGPADLDSSRLIDLPREPAGRLESTRISGAFADYPDIQSVLQPVDKDIYQLMNATLAGSAVPIVMTGVQGNRWYSRASNVFHVSDHLRDSCYRPKTTYQRNRLAGYAVMHVTRPVLSAGQFLVTCCYAADARILLPPFPPVSHEDDTIFGLLVRHCYPESGYLHLPVAVDHTLSPHRPMPKTEFSDVTVRFGDLTRLLLYYLTQVAAPSETDPADRLIHLGTQLGRLSEASHADWLDLSHELTIAAATREVEILEQLKDRHNNEPRWWARDVDDHIERLMRRALIR